MLGYEECAPPHSLSIFEQDYWHQMGNVLFCSESRPKKIAGVDRSELVKGCGMVLLAA